MRLWLLDKINRLVWNRSMKQRIDMSILNRLIEPQGSERRLAIRICRANSSLDPDTGVPEPDREKAERTWREVFTSLPDEKWLWMWNHGRAEWDPTYMPREE